MKKAVIIPMGASPAVATEIVRYLEPEGLTDVILLPTRDKTVLEGTRLAEAALRVRYPSIRVHLKIIPVLDVTDDKTVVEVMKTAASAICKEKFDYHVDTLYLSISGGRKVMSVIAAIIGFAFGVTEIYHVIHGEIKNYNPSQDTIRSLIEDFGEENIQKRISLYIEHMDVLNELLFPPGEKLSYVKIPVLPYPQEYISLLKRILTTSGAYFEEEKIDPILLEMLRRANIVEYNDYRVWPTDLGLELGRMLRCEYR